MKYEARAWNIEQNIHVKNIANLRQMHYHTLIIHYCKTVPFVTERTYLRAAV